MLHAFIELDTAYLFVPTHTDPAIFIPLAGRTISIPA